VLLSEKETKMLEVPHLRKSPLTGMAIGLNADSYTEEEA